MSGSLRTRFSDHWGHRNSGRRVLCYCALGTFQMELSPSFILLTRCLSVWMWPREEEHSARMGRAGMFLKRQLWSPPFIYEHPWHCLLNDPGPALRPRGSSRDMFRDVPVWVDCGLGRGDPLRVAIPGLPAKPSENELPGFLQRLLGCDLYTKM